MGCRPLHLVFSLVVAVGVLVAAADTFAAVDSADLYVSPAGNDVWSGKLPEPNPDRSDGPLATLDAARLKVRAIRPASQSTSRPGVPKPLVIAIRGGTYFLNQPVVFASQDSGLALVPIVYRAFKDEQPTLSGGIPINGWKVDPNGRWNIVLDDVKAGTWDFSQLFVNGQRRMRPRLPKKEYHFIAGRVPPADPATKKGDDRFRFSDEDIRTDWVNTADVEVVTFHPWFTSMLRIAEVDTVEKVVRFTGNTRTTAAFGQLTGGMRYFVDNVAEALTEPGEWYLDKPTGKLTYIPFPGETPDRTVVIAPRLPQLIAIQGDAKAGVPVASLQFSGLRFAHTNWTTPKDGSSISQAAVTVNAAVQATFASNLSFEQCTFAQAGTYGLELGVGCKDVTVERCQFTDLGTGGLKIGTTGFPGSPAQLVERIKVYDNMLAHLGRIHPAAVGVWIGHAADVTVDHNAIYDLYYTCISSGWVWGYGKTANRNIRITNNDLHHYGQGVLSDMGGIYTLGASPNSVIEGNRIHDCERDVYGGWGIYYDEGSSGWTSRNNSLYRLHDGGFHQHYGAENVFENNMLLDSREVQWGPTRIDTPINPGKALERTAFTFERNVIVGWGASSVVRGEAMGKLILSRPDLVKARQNLYWNHGKPLKFGNYDLAEWQRRGFDAGSELVNPKLPPDPDRPEFQVPADSPAVKLGFVPFNVATAGVATNVPTDLNPTRWPRWFPPADHKPRPLADGFEQTPVGATPERAQVHEQPPVATIRVSDEQAYAGKRSLKIQDAPGVKPTYYPFVEWHPNWSSGMAVGRFAIRNDGAWISHEWRGAGYPYATGPSIVVSRDGTFTAGKQELCKVGQGKWVLVEIRCPLGDKAGTYEVTVTPQDEKPATFKDLKCGPGFKEVRWFGFSGASDSGAAYLDEVSLSAK